MERFHVIDDGACILRTKGVWKQAKVYRRERRVYAGHGGGYVRLLRGSATSDPNISWDGIDAEGVLWTGPAVEPKWVG